MDDLDILFSRIEQLELPPGTRETHLARIARATGREPGSTAAAEPIVDLPVRRRHTTAAALLTGAAVVAIVTTAAFLFVPSQTPVAPMTQPTTTQATAATSSSGPNLLTAESSATELANILHISPAAAHAGLARLAALVDPSGNLDPNSEGFHSVAVDLGTTPAGLDQALTQIKAAANPSDTGHDIKQPDGTKAAGSSTAGTDLLTAPGSVVKLAAILNISQTDARTALTGLAALVDQAGRLDDTTPQFRTIATQIGTTPAALTAALARLKASATNVTADDSAKSKSLSAGQPTKGSGQGDLLTAAGTADRLAQLLHISSATAKSGLTQLIALADRDHGLNPTSQEFTTIATDIGTTPAALTEALRQLKMGN